MQDARSPSQPPPPGCLPRWINPKPLHEEEPLPARRDETVGDENVEEEGYILVNNVVRSNDGGASCWQASESEEGATAEEMRGDDRSAGKREGKEEEGSRLQLRVRVGRQEGQRERPKRMLVVRVLLGDGAYVSDC